MIIVHRLNGPPVALNCDLVERAEATPDTILTMVDGNKYVVMESVDEVVDAVRRFRASVLAMAHLIEMGAAPVAPPVLRVVTPDED